MKNMDTMLGIAAAASERLGEAGEALDQEEFRAWKDWNRTIKEALGIRKTKIKAASDLWKKDRRSDGSKQAYATQVRQANELLSQAVSVAAEKFRSSAKTPKAAAFIEESVTRGLDATTSRISASTLQVRFRVGEIDREEYERERAEVQVDGEDQE